MTATSPAPVAWSAGTQPPRTPVPDQVVDCHMHIFDPRLPVDPTARNYGFEASVAQYRQLQQRLGITRLVVVQPSTYGTDNQGLTAALAAFGPASARGVAVVDDHVSDAQLQALHQAGVRGVRFNFVRSGSAVHLDMLAPLAARLAALGWHAQIQAPPDLIHREQALWAQLPCPVVFDHFGGVLQASGEPHPAYFTLQNLLQSGRAWVKLSAPYLVSRAGGPHYQDLADIARGFISAAPERMLWATNWPHATETHKPDDAAVMDVFSHWAGSAAVLKQIWVDNPTMLYDFPASSAA